MAVVVQRCSGGSWDVPGIIRGVELNPDRLYTKWLTPHPKSQARYARP